MPIFISAGWYFIRRNFWQRHVVCMVTAVVSSALFLVGYITYHIHVGEKSSGFRGWLAAIYFSNAGDARFARLRHPSAGRSHPDSGFSAPLGQASPDRQMDDADLALRFRHRRARLFDALSMVSATESCTAALNVVCSGRGQAAYKTMVTIATFNEQSKAKHLRDRLGQAGIGADIIGDSHLQRVAFMAKPRANVKVKVNEDDFGKAHQLMREWEVSDPDVGAALRCPQCESSNIEYPQMTRKFLTPAIASILFAVKIFPKGFYCHNCHFTWTNEPEGQISRLWHMIFPGDPTCTEKSDFGRDATCVASR